VHQNFHAPCAKLLLLQHRKQCPLRLAIDLFNPWAMYAYFAYLAYIANSAYLKYMYIFCDVQAAFDPEGIQFKTFPTMARHIVDAMLPKEQGKINRISLHEGSLSMPVFKDVYNNNNFFSYGW
jgi:hypothetical protein